MFVCSVQMYRGIGSIQSYKIKTQSMCTEACAVIRHICVWYHTTVCAVLYCSCIVYTSTLQYFVQVTLEFRKKSSRVETVRREVLIVTVGTHSLVPGACYVSLHPAVLIIIATKTDITDSQFVNFRFIYIVCY